MTNDADPRRGEGADVINIESVLEFLATPSGAPGALPSVHVSYKGGEVTLSKPESCSLGADTRQLWRCDGHDGWVYILAIAEGELGDLLMLVGALSYWLLLGWALVAIEGVILRQLGLIQKKCSNRYLAAPFYLRHFEHWSLLAYSVLFGVGVLVTIA